MTTKVRISHAEPPECRTEIVVTPVDPKDPRKKLGLPRVMQANTDFTGYVYDGTAFLVTRRPTSETMPRAKEQEEQEEQEEQAEEENSENTEGTSDSEQT